MKKLILAALLLMVPVLSACNTIEGVGEDVESGGEAMQRSANEHK